ncbi:MAG: NlpC/P60 family protein [Spirochaetaceae bacterium]|nr:NlpC/P60 family protein [Spirochaetaceae bacterium]
MTRSSQLRRALASLLASVVVTTLGVGSLGGPATAEPKPTLRQVQRQVEVLHHQAEQATERFNTARVAHRESTRKLRAVRGRFDRQRKSFDEMRLLVGRLAAVRYMSGSIDNGVALLFSENPTTFLRQAGDLEQLNQQQGALLRRMATVRLRLTQDRLALRQQRSQAAAIEADLAVERRSVETRLGQARSLLATLEAPQRARLVEQRQAAEVRALDVRDGAMRASRDAREGTFPTDDGPASGRAADAVRAAYAQLGDPYSWGSAGPGSFDCSGLTMYAWRAAGVSLPHSSSAQYSAVRRISVSDLQPGDLVFYYSPISHVAMYVGGGKVIDAPYPGLSVHVVDVNSMPIVGAGRP